MREWTQIEWAQNLEQIARLAVAQHGPMNVGPVTITPMAGQPYGVADDAPSTITRLRIECPVALCAGPDAGPVTYINCWSGWRGSWREAYGLARRLARRARRVATVGCPGPATAPPPGHPAESAR